METQKEEKNKKVGMVISGAFHLLLLLAFLFIIAWKEPDPPIPQYGIELNFGLDAQGSGNVQPQTPVEPTPTEEEAAPEDVPEQNVEETADSEPVEEPTETQPETTQTTENTQQSPDVVEQTRKVTEETVVEEKKEKQEPKPKKVEETKPKNPADGAKGTEGESQEVANANQGDNIDAEGDKGDEQGTLDSRALYGDPGGGGGHALSIVGWMWDKVPDQKDDSSENGQVVIDFWIDEEGVVLRTRIVQTGVSMSVAKFYEDQLRQIEFSKTSSGTVTQAMTKGTVTFNIKSK